MNVEGFRALGFRGVFARILSVFAWILSAFARILCAFARILCGFAWILYIYLNGFCVFAWILWVRMDSVYIYMVFSTPPSKSNSNSSKFQASPIKTHANPFWISQIPVFGVEMWCNMRGCCKGGGSKLQMGLQSLSLPADRDKVLISMGHLSLPVGKDKNWSLVCYFDPPL